MPKGINQASYERLAKVAQDIGYDMDYKQIQHRLQDLVSEIEPYVDGHVLGGVLSNLEELPADQLTEENFIPLFSYFNKVLKRKDIGNKEIYEELSRKLYYMMMQELNIPNSRPVDEY